MESSGSSCQASLEGRAGNSCYIHKGTSQWIEPEKLAQATDMNCSKSQNALGYMATAP